jgi:arylsulfatase A-like enzyme
MSDGTNPIGLRDGTNPIGLRDGTNPIGLRDGTNPIGPWSHERERNEPNSSLARKSWIGAIGFVLAFQLATVGEAQAPKRPNVLLIITDDQGYGDLGFHGNPQVKTPRLDALAKESARFRSFYVSPVCSPTRASLMTGRYAYRTGIVDTFRGRSMMHSDEVTLAEMLGASGYRTGIFGKWHLGDNAPLRPIDQGFDEALVLRGGGIGQASDTPGSGYFDPILIHNGKEEKTRGYCSDVFADAAIRFIEAESGHPFFAYLAFNAPHEPLIVPENDLKPYLGLVPFRGEPGIGHPLPAKLAAEEMAKVYAMVSNLDANIGRVLDRLDALGLARDTIVVFLTDNGPWKPRFNAGMLDVKGSVHEGGIHVPCFVRWAGTIEAGRVVEPIASAMDLAPTLLAACGVARPESVAFDGRSLLPLLKGEAVDWPDRTLYFQWHRGDVPQPRRAFAARSERYKLAQPKGIEPVALSRLPHFELFDMVSDPLETADIAEGHPDVVARMLEGYDGWFRDVAESRNFKPPRIHLGSPREDPATLTRQDWRGEAIEWERGVLGGWDVEVIRPGKYDLEVIYALGAAGAVRIELSGVSERREIGPGTRSCRFEGFELRPGLGRLQARVERPSGTVAAYQVVVHRRD